MRHQTIRKCLLTLLSLLMAVTSFAQSSGDKLFMEGQTLQKTQTAAAQRQAIKKFQSAKVVYTTADKKRMCENQIAICKQNIANLGRTVSGRSRRVQESSASETAVSFGLSQNYVEFDGDKSGSVVVNVQSPSLDWIFNMPEGIEGETNFVEVIRSNDGKSIEISAKANPSTIMRKQTVNVSRGSSTERIRIRQNGKAVTLSTSSSLVEYGVKGGNKTIELYTNSDSVIASNNNLTWYVESKPSWIEVSQEVKKKKSIVGKGLSVIKGLVESKAEAADDDDSKMSAVQIVAVPLLKSDREYLTGRRGEIVFASQDKRYKVIVVQQK